jgi:hypothetical protein
MIALVVLSVIGAGGLALEYRLDNWVACVWFAVFAILAIRTATAHGTSKAILALQLIGAAVAIASALSVLTIR